MKLPKEEVFRRVIIAAYNRILSDERLTEDLSLLDAMQDCFSGNDINMHEWSVSKSGNIRFK